MADVTEQDRLLRLQEGMRAASATPHPDPPTPPSPRNLKRRWVLLGLVVTVVAVSFGTWRIISPHGSGDPGGKILGALHAVRGAVPLGATSVSEHGQEPVWIGSCDVMYFTKGWSTVNDDFDFTSNLSVGLALTYVSNWMTEHGWQVAPGTSGEQWTRRLPQGVDATATLQYSQPIAGAPNTGMIELSSASVAPAGECGAA